MKSKPAFSLLAALLLAPLAGLHAADVTKPNIVLSNMSKCATRRYPGANRLVTF